MAVVLVESLTRARAARSCFVKLRPCPRIMRTLHSQGCASPTRPLFQLCKGGRISKEFTVFGRSTLSSLYQGVSLTSVGVRFNSSDATKITDLSAILPESTPAVASEAVISSTERAVSAASSASTPLVSDVASALDLSSTVTEGLITADPILPEVAWYKSNVLLQLVDYLHTSYDLPWIASIAAVTFAVRCVIFPLMTYTHINNARVNNIKSQVNEFNVRIKDALFNGDQESVVMLKTKMQQVFSINKCNPLLVAVSPIVNVSLFLLFASSTKTLASTHALIDDSVLWLANLSLPDPFIILPVMSCLLLISNFEMSKKAGTWPTTLGYLPPYYIIRILCIGLVPVTATFPAVFFSYWITSIVFNLLVQFAMTLPVLRRLLNIHEPKQMIVFHSTSTKTQDQDDEEIEKIKDPATEITTIKQTELLSDIATDTALPKEQEEEKEQGEENESSSNVQPRVSFKKAACEVQKQQKEIN